MRRRKLLVALAGLKSGCTCAQKFRHGQRTRITYVV
jgi:hypothetical protein